MAGGRAHTRDGTASPALRVEEPEHRPDAAAAPETTGAVDALYFQRGQAGTTERRAVVGEAPLTIELVGTKASYTIMRTPGDETDLALGFLFAEGMIENRDDVETIEECRDGSVVRVRLAERAEAGRATLATRTLVVSSSCGLCGRDGIEALLASLTAVAGGVQVALDALYSLPNTVREAQDLFRLTGGCHAAALFDRTGALVAVREDLGRHSAFDKLLGHGLRERLRFAEYGVLISGRTSLEMVVKAARARIALLVAVSAPSHAAVQACDRLGITLCGFARGDEVAVYTHPHRIIR